MGRGVEWAGLRCFGYGKRLGGDVLQVMGRENRQNFNMDTRHTDHEDGILTTSKIMETHRMEGLCWENVTTGLLHKKFIHQQWSF